MTDRFTALQQRIRPIIRLREVAGLLDWDQQTYMPPGAAAARAEQHAVLHRFVHEMFTADATGALLEEAEAEIGGIDPDSDRARTLVVLRRDFDLSTRVPGDLVAEIAQQSALAHSVWLHARADNDFPSFAPSIEKMFDLSRRVADCLGYSDHPYDALLDRFEQGFTLKRVQQMFDDIKPALIDLARAIASGPARHRSPLSGEFDVARQRELTLHVVRQIGYDLTRGRQDEAAHPFCSGASRDDVRITTRYNRAQLTQALYASLHEAGHAMYEQGIPKEYDGTPLGSAVSLGVHESQSRFWENMIGRGRPFCAYLLPYLRYGFPAAAASLTVDDVYTAVNLVEPSLIRVEADEVTYNLHIMLRFELESALLNGDLAVSDLPVAWNDRMEQYLGIRPPTDADGVLQDVHWAGGLIGYFPTYSIGNLLSAQLWFAARRDLPDIDCGIEAGDFSPVLSWLREHVHRYGAKYRPEELIQIATGEPLTSRYYREYLTVKYADLYDL